MTLKSNLKSSIGILCLILVSSTALAQIRGNGNVVQMTRDISSFSGISIRSGIDLFIQQGSSISLEIKADENLQEHIITEVKDDILYIYVEKDARIWHSKAMEAYITVTDLESVSISGGGDVEGLSAIQSENLEISISGGGDLNMELNAGKVRSDMSGGGDIDLKGDIQDFELELSGGGDLELNAEVGLLGVSISGGGDAHIDGGTKVSDANILISGGGDLDMVLECAKLKIGISGGGDAKVKAGPEVDEAKVSITGGGDLELALEAKNLYLTVGSGGDATLVGSSVALSAEIKSGGDLYASEFKTEEVMLRLTGGSDARVYVTGQLNVEASGGGQIYVSGDPRINANLSGGSKIHKK